MFNSFLINLTNCLTKGLIRVILSQKITEVVTMIDKELQEFGEDKRKNRMIGIKITEEEYRELKTHCDEHEVSISKYMRYLYQTDREIREHGET